MKFIMIFTMLLKSTHEKLKRRINADVKSQGF